MEILFFIIIAVLTAGSMVFLFRKLPQKLGVSLAILFGLLALVLYVMLGAPKMI
ncbi:MAG TPA: hypothetical protein PKW15_08105 [Alphaproteobacteria bacterium]|nr:hypothetical protein [Alphaproteobacteria bacterium]